MPSAAVAIQKHANFRPGLAMQIAPFRSVLLTAWPKLNTGPWPNQTKARAELRRKCGKSLANSGAFKFKSLANFHFVARRARMFVAKYARCIYIKASLLEPRRDLHDFDQFAVRTLASEAHAGRLYGSLRTVSVSTDRA
jgi:hypothetical protein